MLAGDFTAFTSPACNAGRQVTLRAPFVNNQINPALYSSAAKKIAAQLPSTTDPCGNVRYSSPQKNNQGQIIGKMDYQASANHSMLARYMVTFDQQNASWPSSGNVLTTAIPDAYQKHTAHSLALGDTRILGPNCVNVFRL